MKKWLALIVAIITVLFLSAGCADGGMFVEYTAKARDSADGDISDLLWDTMGIILNRLESAGVKGCRIEQIGIEGIRVEIPYEYCKDGKITEVLELIGAPGELLFIDPEGNVFMNGDMVKSAEYYYAEGDHQIAFQLTEEGSDLFADMTSKSIGRVISIILDGELLIAPTVQMPITGGAGVINGLQSKERATRIAAQIQSGTLPVELTQDRMDYWAEYKESDSESSGILDGEWRIISISGEGSEDINAALTAGIEVRMVFRDGVLTIEAPFIDENMDTSQRYRIEGSNIIWVYDDGTENNNLAFFLEGNKLHLIQNGTVVAVLERK